MIILKLGQDIFIIILGKSSVCHGDSDKYWWWRQVYWRHE